MLGFIKRRIDAIIQNHRDEREMNIVLDLIHTMHPNTMDNEIGMIYIERNPGVDRIESIDDVSNIEVYGRDDDGKE